MEAKLTKVQGGMNLDDSACDFAPRRVAANTAGTTKTVNAVRRGKKNVNTSSGSKDKTTSQAALVPVLESSKDVPCLEDTGNDAKTSISISRDDEATKHCRSCDEGVPRSLYRAHLTDCLRNKYSKVTTTGKGSAESSHPTVVLCQICQEDLSHCIPEERQRHVNGCMDSEGVKSKENCQKTPTEKKAVPKEDDSMCQICQKDLKRLNTQRRMQHINHCIDKDASANQRAVEDAGATKPAKTKVLDCPICGQKLKTHSSRKTHLKKCAAKFGVSTTVLMERVKEQEELYRIQLACDFLSPHAGIKLPGPKREKKPVKKRHVELITPQSALDADTQLAIALSNSMKGECAEPVKCPLEDVSNANLETFDGNTTNAFNLLMSQKAEEKQSKKGRRKQKKNVVPEMLLVDPEEAKKLLAEKVASIILSEHNNEGLQSTPPSKKSSLAKAYHRTGHTTEEQTNHWVLSHLESKLDRQAFYVQELMPPIEYCSVVTGSKVKHVSLIPGRDLDQTECQASEKEFAPTQTAGILAELAANNATQNDISQLDTTLPCAHTEKSLGKDLDATGFILDSEDCSADKGELVETLCTDMENMISNPKLSDVKLKVKNGEVIPAHKFMLVARCPQLSRLFTTLGQSSELSLEEYSRDSVIAVLNYMYAARTKVPNNCVFEVKRLAHKLSMKDLICICDKMIEESGMEQCVVGNDADVTYDRDLNDLLKEVWSSDDEVSEREDSQEDNLIDELYHFKATEKLERVTHEETASTLASNSGLRDIQSTEEETNTGSEALMGDSESEIEILPHKFPVSGNGRNSNDKDSADTVLGTSQPESVTMEEGFGNERVYGESGKMEINQVDPDVPPKPITLESPGETNLGQHILAELQESFGEYEEEGNQCMASASCNNLNNDISNQRSELRQSGIALPDHSSSKSVENCFIINNSKAAVPGGIEQDDSVGDTADSDDGNISKPACTTLTPSNDGSGDNCDKERHTGEVSDEDIVLIESDAELSDSNHEAQASMLGENAVSDKSELLFESFHAMSDTDDEGKERPDLQECGTLHSGQRASILDSPIFPKSGRAGRSSCLHSPSTVDDMQPGLEQSNDGNLSVTSPVSKKANSISPLQKGLVSKYSKLTSPTTAKDYLPSHIDDNIDKDVDLIDITGDCDDDCDAESFPTCENIGGRQLASVGKGIVDNITCSPDLPCSGADSTPVSGSNRVDKRKASIEIVNEDCVKKRKLKTCSPEKIIFSTCSQSDIPAIVKSKRNFKFRRSKLPDLRPNRTETDPELEGSSSYQAKASINDLHSLSIDSDTIDLTLDKEDLESVEMCDPEGMEDTRGLGKVAPLEAEKEQTHSEVESRDDQDEDEAEPEDYNVWSDFDDDGFVDLYPSSQLQSQGKNNSGETTCQEKQPVEEKLSASAEAMFALSSPVTEGEHTVACVSPSSGHDPLAEAEHFDPPSDFEDEVDSKSMLESADVPATSSKEDQVHIMVTPQASAPMRRTERAAAVPPSPFTPMPDYDDMVTPELMKKGQDYGLRNLPKKKMRVVLKQIYESTHQYETDSEFEKSISNSPGQSAPAQSSSGSKALTSRSTAAARSSSDQVSPDSDSDEDMCLGGDVADGVIMEESFMVQNKKGKKGSSKEDVAAKRKKIIDYIKGNKELYLKILDYEPFELTQFREELRNAGVKVNAAIVMDVLDEQNIQFTMKSSRKGKATQQATRRKKKAKVTPSQNVDDEIVL